MREIDLGEVVVREVELTFVSPDTIRRGMLAANLDVEDYWDNLEAKVERGDYRMMIAQIRYYADENQYFKLSLYEKGSINEIDIDDGDFYTGDPYIVREIINDLIARADSVKETMVEGGIN